MRHWCNTFGKVNLTRIADQQKLGLRNSQEREPTVNTVDLQGSGDERRNKPLLKPAEPITPDQLEAREVVFQTCLLGRRERTGKTRQNTLKPNRQRGYICFQTLEHLITKNCKLVCFSQ